MMIYLSKSQVKTLKTAPKSTLCHTSLSAISFFQYLPSPVIPARYSRESMTPIKTGQLSGSPVVRKPTIRS